MDKPLYLPVVEFKTQEEWARWLGEHHESEKGVWMRLFNKASGMKGITYAEALDEALCYGWIDGQARKYDDKSHIQRFTPRRARSVWSKRNTEHIERLTKLEKMKPAGIAQVEAAKADGRWAQAYSSPGNMEMPEDFLDELRKDKEALAFFEGLNKTNKFAIYFQITSAKRPETRERRKQRFLKMMKEGKKLY